MRLIQGDCLEILPTLGVERRRLVLITDPPYGVELGVRNDQRGGSRHLGKRGYASYEDTYENFVALIVPRLKLALSLCCRGAVFTGPHVWEQPKADAIGGIYLPAATGRHCWGFKNFLPVLLYGTAPDLHQGSRHSVFHSHPCAKPVEWMLWLVEHASRPGDVILDPFMGSGTTGVAALRRGRDFIGIESDAGYFAVAQRRVAEAEACRDGRGVGELFATLEGSA